MSEKSKKQKVSIVEKMGLFMVCAGNIPLMGLLSGFFMIYYTNVAPQECGALRIKWNGYNISSHGLTFYKLTSSNVTPH